MYSSMKIALDARMPTTAGAWAFWLAIHSGPLRTWVFPWSARLYGRPKSS